jgi:hypothetical protein
MNNTATFTFNLNITVPMNVPVNVPVTIGISIGEPVLTVNKAPVIEEIAVEHRPVEFARQQRPLRHLDRPIEEPTLAVPDTFSWYEMPDIDKKEDVDWQKSGF